ncbi:hypothetical protein GCM10011583_66060 [Streptomyces camponoticapitis]|uniref:Uncharacterized protein n=1 Tax=Streptomyces camponoticapitis TaxID=1616125 RepID=A0ABQ2ETC5_9ACTN|nr:hypothetical protein GCM10011583_66060 [Streptomyces camponoticapitis]
MCSILSPAGSPEASRSVGAYCHTDSGLAAATPVGGEAEPEGNPVTPEQEVEAGSYAVRYWGGPLDGGEERIACPYPPRSLNGYGLSHSKLGRYYVYTWAKRMRSQADSV